MPPGSPRFNLPCILHRMLNSLVFVGKFVGVCLVQAKPRSRHADDHCMSSMITTITFAAT